MERAQALVDVMKEEAEKAQARRSRHPRGPLALRRYLVLALVALATLYVFYASPDWVDGETDAPVVTPSQEMAGVRLSLYLQAHKIEVFRARTGRLPQALEEAGTVEPGVVYVRPGDGSYLLEGTEGTAFLTYISGEPLEYFVADAFEVLGLPREAAP